MMPLQLTRDYQDKKLNITFEDGEVADVKVLAVCECDQHEDCRGIVYDVISSNRLDRFKKGSAYWTELKYIRAFEGIGD
ncbi:MAG TPA: hypothetical protein VMR90_10210 [Candidatus Cybelea sp.]|nr:hypothetical protein [Candidatus Cybelea sp.]